MNDLVEQFMTEYKAKVEAEGCEAAHAYADETLLPRITDGMNDEEVKALQEALITPVTEFLFALSKEEVIAEPVVTEDV